MHFLSYLPLLASTVSALAFPGAEGFGKDAIGGRNGKVYVVSNLNDSGAGSLRDAVSQPDRIIVFQVGGLIKIKERIVVSKRVSILGQTAPGEGITVYGNGWSFSNADDTIIRYIRIRMGKGGTSGKDAAGIAEGKNMIFDHISVSWGRDETFSINGAAANITIQVCTPSVLHRMLLTQTELYYCTRPRNTLMRRFDANRTRQWHLTLPQSVHRQQDTQSQSQRYK
jgi:pectate lyase